MTIIKSSLFTSIQDAGRLSYRENGVPHSGAMDQESFVLANELIKNPLNTSVIEMTLTGGSYLFSRSCTVAITGATANVTVNRKEVGQVPLTVSIKTGDALVIGTATKGNYNYLAIAGGFQIEKKLESASYYPKICGESLLEKGSILEYHSHKIILNSLSSTSVDLDQVLHCLPGTEFQLLSRKLQQKLLENSFTVSSLQNRMAFQLNELIVHDLKPIASSPVLPGTVQLSPEGKLIVLMRDAQTTGGYPRILQLTEAAINQLAQTRAGEQVGFVVDGLLGKQS